MLELGGLGLDILRREKDKRKQAERGKYAKWRTDPIGFVHERLLGFLWSKQRAICQSVLDNRLTAVPSCHDSGKALHVDEPVLTPWGWRSIGTLKVGDEVIAGSGGVCRVLGVYPQGIRPLFRVTMSDGVSVLADADHLWSTKTRSDRRARRSYQVRTTREIARTLTFPNGKIQAPSHSIPVFSPVEDDDIPLPVDPYVLGQWLGDGVLNGRITGMSDQIDELERAGAHVSRSAERGNESVSVKGLRVALRGLALLGLYSHERFIPPLYLRSARRQREALLQGLMDADGTVGKGRGLTFDTTSPRLAEDVAELMRSLGGVVRTGGRFPKFKGDTHRYCYRIFPYLPQTVRPFRLARKLSVGGRAWGNPNAERWGLRLISAIEPAGEGPAVCIRVSDPSQTFVTRGHIVTHNSFIASRLAAWWISVHEPGEAFVVTVAPTHHQVRGILWREMKRVHVTGGLPGRMNQTEWWIGEELVAFGRSPADHDPTAVQGIHARRVLVIVDEACGIARPIWDALSSLYANEDSRCLAIGNPDDPTTYFEEICRPGSGWNVIPVDGFETPNFTDESVPDWLRPLLISRIWERERAKAWGVGSMRYQSKVRGKFPEQSADALIPLWALTAAVARGLGKPVPTSADVLGVDVARFGDDASVIMARLGNQTWKHVEHRKRDLMTLTGFVVQAIHALNPLRVHIDDAGMGGGVTDRLMELQAEGKVPATVTIVGINVGEAPKTDLSDERFKNLRAEINWSARTKFIEGTIELITPEADPNALDQLLSEASQVLQKPTSTGEIQIEKKHDMKKRLSGVSPDNWDALVLCHASPNWSGEGVMAFYEVQAARQRVEVERLSAPPASPGNGIRQKPPPPPEPTHLAKIYTHGLSGFQPKPPTCKICGRLLGATRISDGFEQWHQPGDPACRKGDEHDDASEMEKPQGR